MSKYNVDWKVTGTITVEARTEQEAQNIILAMPEEEIEELVLDKIESFETGKVDKFY